MTRVWGWLRELLAVGLLAGFYLLAAVLVTVSVALAALVVWASFQGTPNGGFVLVVAGTIAAVSALVYGVATVSRTPDQPTGAVFVRRREAPELWRLVEQLAGQLGTRPPARIYLTPEANAAVSEQARWLGLVLGARTLYLGVPLLTRLPPAQLRAVLCHELGHYASGHTAFGAVIYRGGAALQEALFRLRMTAAARTGYAGYAWFYARIIGAYAWVYLRLSLAIRRRQELEADAAAVAAAGPAATAGALRTVPALGAAWAGYLDRFFRPVRRLGFVPEDMFEAFAVMVRDPAVRERLAELQANPAEPQRSTMDSHPPLARRLARIEAVQAGDPDPSPHRPLLADRAPLRRIQRGLEDYEGLTTPLPTALPTPLPTVQWMDLAAEAFAIEPAAELLAAARDVAGTDRATLGTVLDLLAQGAATELAAQLTDGPAPAEQLAEALYALVGQALIGQASIDRTPAGAGAARWALSWTEGYRLVCRGQPDGRLLELTAAAASEASEVAALRAELDRRGLDVTRQVPLALRTVAAPAGRIAGTRITAEVPAFVADELARQRSVRTVTLVLLGVLAVPWGIGTLNSFGSDQAPARTYPADLSQGAERAAPLPGPGAGLRPTHPLLVNPTAEPGSLPTYLLPTPSLRAPLLPDSVLARPPTEIEVERGDTLTAIACRYETTVAELQALNDLGAGEDINAGDTLLVPARLVIRTDCG